MPCRNLNYLVFDYLMVSNSYYGPPRKSRIWNFRQFGNSLIRRRFPIAHICAWPSIATPPQFFFSSSPNVLVPSSFAALRHISLSFERLYKPSPPIQVPILLSPSLFLRLSRLFNSTQTLEYVIMFLWVHLHHFSLPLSPNNTFSSTRLLQLTSPTVQLEVPSTSILLSRSLLWVPLHHVSLLLPPNNTLSSTRLLQLTPLFYDRPTQTLEYVIMFSFLWVPLKYVSLLLSLNNTFCSTRLLQLTSLFYYDSPHSHSIPYIFSLMSQSRPSAFSTDARSVNCNTCGRSVEFKPCLSNRNGNKGALFATVRSSPAYVI